MCNEFESWWEEAKSLPQLSGYDLETIRTVCAMAWFKSEKKSLLETEDAYNRGRLTMFLCWAVGAAAAVIVYFAARFWS